MSSAGARCADEPNAFKFQWTHAPARSRRRPGESWAEAVAAAEAKYGHRAHEIVVTAEASAAMSRPKPDPRANVAAATTAAEDGQPLQTLDASDAALDANGVDTKLKAPTEAVSRETSGIRDEDSQGAHIGLTQGRIVEETDPGGGRRRVRILTPTD